jgi:hypothetical protein
VQIALEHRSLYEARLSEKGIPARGGPIGLV